MNTEENKYYTPSIEEFHVGFEWEIKSEFAHKFCQDSKDQYVKMIFVETDILNAISIYSKGIRVKHLDKEDIESLGFTEFSDDKIQEIPLEERQENGLFSFVLRYNRYTKIYLYTNLSAHKCSVFRLSKSGYCNDEANWPDINQKELLSRLKIKNKSELIKLMKQLNI